MFLVIHHNIAQASYFAVGCDGLKIHLRASKNSKIYEVAVRKITSYKEEKPNPDGVISIFL